MALLLCNNFCSKSKSPPGACKNIYSKSAFLVFKHGYSRNKSITAEEPLPIYPVGIMILCSLIVIESLLVFLQISLLARKHQIYSLVFYNFLVGLFCPLYSLKVLLLNNLYSHFCK